MKCVEDVWIDALGLNRSTNIVGTLMVEEPTSASSRASTKKCVVVLTLEQHTLALKCKFGTAGGILAQPAKGAALL